LAIGETSPSEARRQFHNALLPGTVANALKTPFFSDILGEVDPSKIDVETLQALPLVSKHKIVEAGRRARIADGQLLDEILSTGTTGEPFVTVRGAREQAFIRDFYQRAGGDPENGRLIRGVHVVNPRHGHHVTVPSPFYFHRLTLFDMGSFDYGASLLGQTFDDPNIEPVCTVLSGGERSVRAFIAHIVDRFDLPFESGLEYALTFGHYVPKHFRAFLDKQFGIRVLDRFSLSEMFGGASESLACGWYHFDPVVLPEVLSVVDRRPLTEGVGELVLTALYPFQEAQPLIRYATGDLVEVTHSRSSIPNTLAVRPFGRIQFSVRSPTGPGWLIAATQLYDALDDCPELARSPEFLGSPVVRDPYALGNPIYDAFAEVVEGSSLHRLVVRVVLKPEITVDRPALRAALTARLANESRDLHAVAGRPVEIDVRFADSIEKPFSV
jgi:phenylacetate-coenzyme A ligase PaaK-like adenylate-forming protein